MKKAVSIIIICCMLIPSIFQVNVLAYSDIKITYNGQVVDSFAGVDAIYATLSSYSNVDTNTTYSCAAFLKKFCSKLWGVTIYNINTVNAAPTITKAGHSVSLKTVSTPRPGDIMQTKNYGHVAVVKSVSGSNAILIEQNWSYNSGGYRYARKERSVPISSVYFYRMIIDGVEAEVPGVTTTSTYQINFDANGGTLDTSEKAHFYADAVNTDRGANQIVVYTSGSSTGTNEYGIEYIVNKYGIITEEIYGVGNATIPEGGFVISGHGEAITRLSSNIQIGDYAYYNKWYEDLITIYAPEQGLAAQKWVKNGEQYGDLPIPTKTGYEFKGWFTTVDGGTQITSDSMVTITATQILYAHWTLKTYRVNYDVNDGTLDGSIKVYFYADAVNTDRGTNQIVVYTDGNSTGTNEYGIEYIVNKYGIITEEIYGAGNATIPEGGFVISGHGEAVTRLSSNIKVGDYAYYNKWYLDKISIYNPEQGIVSQKWVVSGEKYGALPIPKRDGYFFKGWFASENGEKEITSDTIVTTEEDITLYAKWESTIPYIESTVIKKGIIHSIETKLYNFVDPCDILVVGYKNNNYVTMQKTSYSEETASNVIEGDIDEIKVMVWDGLSTLKPLCEAEAIPSSKWKTE